MDFRFRNLYYIVMLFFLFACREEIHHENGLKAGIWRGEITAQQNKIPFDFKVSRQGDKIVIDLIDGDQEIRIDEVNLIKDTLSFNMHIFDATIKAAVENDSMTGYYTKNYNEDYQLPFRAYYNKPGRFDDVSSDGRFDGKWETAFFTLDSTKTPAIGIFRTENNILKGTFLTPTGDYRFLDGYNVQDTMYLYSFDGNHIFKFRAVLERDSILKGEFWSGKNTYKTFTAVKNDSAELPQNDRLNSINEGFEKIGFSFKGVDGKPRNITDKKYRGKVVILQILGTWCPNCMDETLFLADWYKKNKHRGVEIIGLAFENKADFDYAKARVEKMKDKLHVDYDVLIAGTSSLKSVKEALPMINGVNAFPTTIFIDKKGNVRKIHSGFNGPATASYYDAFVEEFNQFVNELLKE